MKVQYLFIVLLMILFSVSCLYKEVQKTETFIDTEYKTEYRTETYTETQNEVVKLQQGKQILRPSVRWSGYNILPHLPSIEAIQYYGYNVETWGHTTNQIKITIDRGALNQKGIIKVYDGLGNIPVIPTSTHPIFCGWSFQQQAWIDWVTYSINHARLLGQMTTGEYRASGTDVSKLPNEIVFNADGVSSFGIFANTYYYEVVYKVEYIWSDETIKQKTITRERQVPYQVPVQVEKQKIVTDVIKVPFWEAIFK